MKTHAVILAAAALFISGSAASAQKTYDSLGMPTPAPNQGVSPNAVPNSPNTGGVSTTVPVDTSGTSTTTGSATSTTPKVSVKPGDPTSGVPLTPGGLTPD